LCIRFVELSKRHKKKKSKSVYFLTVVLCFCIGFFTLCVFKKVGSVRLVFELRCLRIYFSNSAHRFIGKPHIQGRQWRKTSHLLRQQQRQPQLARQRFAAPIGLKQRSSDLRGQSTFQCL
jgi:hypothetical protein